MPSLTSIAERLLELAKEIDSFTESEGLEYPSPHVDTLTALPPSLQSARKNLSSGSDDLKKLAQGPATRGLELALSWTDLLTLRVIIHYRIADIVPLDNNVSYAEIAVRVGLPEDVIRRFLRNAIANDIFDEVPASPGRLRHTAFSSLLATDPGFRAMLGLQVDELGPASTVYITTLEKHKDGADEPPQTAFSMYNNTTETIYSYLKSCPVRARRFDDAMQWSARDDSWHLKHLLSSFDWHDVDKVGSRIVDIGGGHGQTSISFAEHLPNPFFEIQDLPEVIESALRAVPQNLAERVTFRAHDFMQPQSPEHRVDAFILRWILHNWPDGHAINILKGLVPAMKPGTKILIFEDTLDNRPARGLNAKAKTNLDIIMATAFNGKERTKADFEQLIKAASCGFVLERIVRPEGSVQSLVELIWRGEN